VWVAKELHMTGTHITGEGGRAGVLEKGRGADAGALDFAFAAIFRKCVAFNDFEMILSTVVLYASASVSSATPDSLNCHFL
jgi:hypothetical protein